MRALLHHNHIHLETLQVVNTSVFQFATWLVTSCAIIRYVSMHISLTSSNLFVAVNLTELTSVATALLILHNISLMHVVYTGFVSLNPLSDAIIKPAVKKKRRKI